MKRGKAQWLSDCSSSRALRRGELTVLAMVQLLSVVQNALGQSTAASVFCEKFAVPFGYRCAEYKTLTADGFFLLAHRMSSPPRPPSQTRGGGGMAAAPTQAFPPVSLTVAPQPFETITDFAGKQAPISKTCTISDPNCRPAAPAPLTISSAEDRHSTFESALAQTPLPQDRGLYEAFRRLKPGRISTTSDDASIQARREDVGEDGLQKWNQEWLDANAVTQKSTADGHQGHHRARRDHSSSDLRIPPSTGSKLLLQSGDDQTLAPVSDAPRPPTSASPDGVLGAQEGAPVLLMHQELLNGDSWFLHTDDDSDQLLPVLLLNAGFDVWIGHQRATYWAHDHATLTPEDQRFWNWTWDEHAKYDMPALLQLVSEETGLTIHFIGLSQSATAGAATATMPEVSPLLRSLTLIGPTIYRGSTSSITVAAWAFLLRNTIDSTNYNTELQHGAFNFSSVFPNYTISRAGPLSAISGPSCCLGSTVVQFNNGWDGTTSYKNLVHFQQGITTNTWRRYDYGGAENNSIAYGVPLPPTYYPEDIPPTLPVLVIYGGQDMTAPPRGCNFFMSQLKSRNNSALLLPDYSHVDLAYSLNRTQDVYMTVLQFLEKQPLIEALQ